jgi:hypothetical protein
MASTCREAMRAGASKTQSRGLCLEDGERSSGALCVFHACDGQIAGGLINSSVSPRCPLEER